MGKGSRIPLACGHLFTPDNFKHLLLYQPTPYFEPVHTLRHPEDCPRDTTLACMHTTPPRPPCLHGTVPSPTSPILQRTTTNTPYQLLPTLPPKPLRRLPLQQHISFTGASQLRLRLRLRPIILPIQQQQRHATSQRRLQRIPVWWLWGEWRHVPVRDAESAGPV